MNFIKLKYRLDEVPEGESVIMHFDDLRKHANAFTFQGDMPPDLSPEFVMRYIILMYSPGTPAQEIPELNKRKAWVLSQLNVRPDKDKKLPESINGLLGNRYQNAVEKIVLFLRINRNMDWAILVAAEQKQSDLLVQMFTAKEDVADERTLQQAIKMNRELYDEQMVKFLDGEKSKELSEAVNQYLSEENLGIDPETYIKHYTETGKPFDADVIP
jgi:hypothetical protein